MAIRPSLATRLVLAIRTAASGYSVKTSEDSTSFLSQQFLHLYLREKIFEISDLPAGGRLFALW